MLTLKDLKSQGLTLSKMDAQELHPLINKVAQWGDDKEVVFEKSDLKEQPKVNPHLETISIISKKLLEAENKIDQLENELAEIKKIGSEKLSVKETELPNESEEQKVKRGRKPNK